ncbi:hypothetical protein C8F04DRAFT_1274271 [Mycena alexandri]|uniref:Uncharacterized protein n=1 Tax=Mycena alexandri TaxID=1745969 RepID=A0AAD6WU19_9AGAR|nr:hypothetical protein C8F04DRAFT_1274271 [Mycena alexandri]
MEPRARAHPLTPLEQRVTTNLQPSTHTLHARPTLHTVVDATAGGDGHPSRDPARLLGDMSNPVDHADAAYKQFIASMEFLDEPTETPFVPPSFFEHACNVAVQGDVFTSPCSLSDLLPIYVRERDERSCDDPPRDLDALHPRFFLRRSLRLQAKPNGSQPSVPALHAQKPTASSSRKKKRNKRPGADSADNMSNPRPTKKWLDSGGKLVVQDRGWRSTEFKLPPPSARSEPALPATGATISALPGIVGGQGGRSNKIMNPLAPSGAEKTKKTRRRTVPPEIKVQRAFSRGDVLEAPAFSLQRDASFSPVGWQGAAPPPLARKEILRLHRAQARGRGLHPYISKFYPVPYKICDSIRDERSTVFVDSAGVIFMFRSSRVSYLRDNADKIEDAITELCSADLKSPAVRAQCKGGMRGDHLPKILGHQRQSATRPQLNAWHAHNPKAAETFINDSTIQSLMYKNRHQHGYNKFPGVAARFLADARWHEERYGIKPLFGLFWNMCINAWFPGQKGIHCDPHADKKNQIGVCVLFIYVLKTGLNFNHTQRTWLVIWEAVVVVELPPWTIAMYPSALLYHFNIDVDEIQFVTTEGNARPTRENARPIVDGDDCGRGSCVFFNQSTMRQGPATGFDTIAQAKLHGHSGRNDYGESAQEAFERHLILILMHTTARKRIISVNCERCTEEGRRIRNVSDALPIFTTRIDSAAHNDRTIDVNCDWHKQELTMVRYLLELGNADDRGTLDIMLRRLPSLIEAGPDDLISMDFVKDLEKRIVQILDANLQHNLDRLVKTHLLRNLLETGNDRCLYLHVAKPSLDFCSATTF